MVKRYELNLAAYFPLIMFYSYLFVTDNSIFLWPTITFFVTDNIHQPDCINDSLHSLSFFFFFLFFLFGTLPTLSQTCLFLHQLSQEEIFHLGSLVKKHIQELFLIKANLSSDFASSSFDAIFYSNTTDSTPETTTKTITTTTGEIQKRSSHLPDLIPFISLITEKCDVQPVHLVMALMYVQRFRRCLPAGNTK